MDLTLYHWAGACSRVTMSALEEIGVSFSTSLVLSSLGEDRRAEYLAINPKGKVPALRIGARLLAENAAILHHLHIHYPSARLLPEQGADFGSNQGLEDLLWCAATLHPITRMIRAPKRFTIGETDGVVALGKDYYQPVLKLLSERFDAAQWWYGAEWSIIDVYLNWNYSTAERGGLDLRGFESLKRHASDVRGRPSFERALARERDDLKRHGIELPYNL